MAPPSHPSTALAPTGIARSLRLPQAAVVLGLLLGLVLLVPACDSGSKPDSSSPPAKPAAPPEVVPPAEAPASDLEATTDSGHYRIATRPAEPPIVLHQMHDWIVRIELVGEGAEIPTAVNFDGGMPSHGHGFVTTPRVTQNLGGGEFRVEGVKFHMPGEWVLRITVTNRSGSETVTLPLLIAP